MFLCDSLRRGPFHDGLNFRLVMESLDIITLKKSYKLSQSDHIVQDNNFVFPLTNIIFSFYFLVEGDNVTGELLFEAGKRSAKMSHPREIFGVFGDVLIDDLCDFAVVWRSPIIYCVFGTHSFETVHFFKFLENKTSHIFLK